MNVERMGDGVAWYCEVNSGVGEDGLLSSVVVACATSSSSSNCC